jgi:NAD(P)-dependent dehydrogenase (short-subunit alcohol dehydrogenase family)
MNVNGQATIVTGGASGLGASTARVLASNGARVCILDINQELGGIIAKELDCHFISCDVTDEKSVLDAFSSVKEIQGCARVIVNCAGIGNAARMVGREGPHDFSLFSKIISVNLIGTFNVTRIFALEATQLEPLEDNERGVVIMTSSIAAFDGQVGQAAYSASKGGIHSMTLPIAREFASRGLRVCTIAPGVLKTPLLDILPTEVQKSLGESIPFPRRLGHADEYASLAMHIIENRYINGETIRLDGALRMSAK